jgi:hypothetical protein
MAEGGAAATGGTAGHGTGGTAGTNANGGTAGTAGASNGTGGSAGTSASGGTAGTAGAGNGTGGSAGTSANGGTAGTSGTANGGSAGGSSPPSSVTLSVHTSQNAHPISPLIYGVNPAAVDCTDAQAHFTLCRLGGNRWSTYNWENNASNGGPDCYENDGALGGDDTPGKAVTDTLTAANGAGAATLVTLPILDHVAGDKLGGSGPPDCSGDTRKSGSDYLDTRYDANVAAKGAAFTTTPDLTDGNVYSDEFVAFLKGGYGTANVLFELDNEPGIWDYSHADVHPSDPTYAEVVSRNVTFAKSTRAQWPTAEIAGYVGYGYADFLNLQGAPDANGLFLDYYLSGLAQASQTASERLVDYLDIHWFPEIYGDNNVRIIGNETTPDIVSLRVQAPRSLWDSTYVESSWITQDTLGGQPIRLVPWLHERIAAGYPGTKVAISAWAYGGGTDPSGAVAAADALGIFGREGVDLAAWQSQTGTDPFVLAAFQAFRNYDGAGATFGDTSVAADSDHIDYASVYASVDSAHPTRVVIIAINRSDAPLPATLTVDDAQTFATADVYAITSASATPVAGTALTVTAANTFSYAMPAYSVSVIVPKT